MYLLDTNVLSRVVRKQPDRTLLEKLHRLPPEALFTSCICVMELRFGAARRRDNGVLWGQIEREILPRVQILGFGMAEAILAGDVAASLQAKGQTIDMEDVLIGVTARTHGLVAVTNNVAHFRRIPGLMVEDWLS